MRWVPLSRALAVEAEHLIYRMECQPCQQKVISVLEGTQWTSKVTEAFHAEINVKETA